ncbi:MAG TPA: hypothetical protein VN922_08790, partial [Bacteroidia bacterium]|nr:hypothetical protein [Bacteroidia bacterium]
PLYGVAVSGTKVYAAGANGTELYMANYGVSSPAQLGAAGGVYTFKAVGATTAGGAILMGNNSNVYMYGGTTGMQTLSLYDCRFWDVNFMDASHGYVVGDSGVIRRTDNGGAMWQTVLPEINAGGGIPDIKTVWTTGAGNAIVGGTNNFFGQSFADNLTVSAGTYNYNGSSSAVWYKVRFNANFLNSGYIVGSGGGMLMPNVSGGIMTSFSTLPSLATPPSAVTSADLHSLHVFRDNSVMVVGSNGIAYYYYPNAAYPTTPYWTNESPTTLSGYPNFIWNDVYFRDDRVGYLVGDSLNGGVPVGGEIVKTISPVNIQPLLPATPNPAPLTWNLEPVQDNLNITHPAQILINSIAFSGPYDGFLGGSYTGSNTSGYPYARLLNDRGGMFSSRYYYDRVGRIVVMQDTKQYNYKRRAYSYTLYDYQERVLEIGQKTENADTMTFAKIFGDTIMGFYNPNVINPGKYLTWIKDNTGPRTEVTHNYYDVQNILPTNLLTQQELRNRVTSITYTDSLNVGDSLKYNTATHYSYDIHGSLVTVVQDDSVQGIIGQRYKRIDYQYDLVSYNINEMDYQQGSVDQYHHKYGYDADNRLVSVCTSKDSILWDRDATYFYYAHEPLARVEIGDQGVQGMDYAYTLSGWIKGVNSNQLDGIHDMGHDALQQSGNLNKHFARDGFGYTLNYFTGDYDPINKSTWNNVANRFEAGAVHSDLMNSRHDLFNGNISAMVTSITQPQTYSQTTPAQQAITLPQGTAYNYDQLNRLIDMKAYRNLDKTNNAWLTNGLQGDMYHNWFTYDANGNILTQKRADSLSNVFDSLTYRYNNNGGTGPTIQNRLYHVNDAISGSIDGIIDDIRDEGIFSSTPSAINQTNNYSYDAVGNLVKDKQEQIDTIIWSVYGKL